MVCTRRLANGGPRWPHTGAILAGGRSRRMGEPKQWVRLWDGRPMIVHVLEALSALCERVVIVGQPEGATTRGIAAEHIPDRRPGSGPLGGIEALLESGLDSVYLVVACDQPLLTPALLRALVAEEAERLCFFNAAAGERLNPFPGLFPARWLPCVQEAMRRGQLSVRRLVEEASPGWVTIEATQRRLLMSINTPGDLALARRIACGEDDPAASAPTANASAR